MNMESFVRDNKGTRAVLIIEGDERQLWKGHKDYPAYNTVKASVAFFNHVTVIPSLNEDTTIMQLRYFQKRETEESKGIQIRPKRRMKTIDEQLIYVLCGFPQIGSNRAQKILSELKSIRGFANASYDDLVILLGSKLADKIFVVLQAKYGEKKDGIKR
jgi:ERCC4-type nuclease